MSKQFLLTGGIAVLIVAAAIGGILFSTRKNRVQLDGEILKVRSHQVDPEHTIVLIDVRIHNPSAQQFVVRGSEVLVEDANGKSVATDPFSEPDIKRYLEYYKMLGQRYSPGLLPRDKINSGQSIDRTVSVSAPMSDDQLGKRKRLRLVVRDVDGPSIELAERR